MNFTFDQIWKLGAVLILAASLYFRVEYLAREIEEDNAALRKQVDQMQKDLKFTTNALMRFQYGEWAVED